MTSQTMQAVIFNGPFNVSIGQRPIPKLQAETDIIVEVSYTALCGSYVLLYYAILFLFNRRVLAVRVFTLRRNFNITW